MILAIDPGTTESAYAYIEKIDGWDAPWISSFGILENSEIEKLIQQNPSQAKILVIEMVVSRGMPIGKTTIDTVLWIGRFLAKFTGPVKLIGRPQVKVTICGHTTAKDTNVKRAILDMYPPAGGGKTPQVGTKTNPGPLYGVKKDIWQAIALGISYFSGAKAYEYEQSTQSHPENNTRESR